MKSAISLLSLVLFLSFCKTPEEKPTAVIAENPAVLRLNYDVVYNTGGNAALLNSGRLFARGLFYECKVTDTASSFETFRASSYTEDNSNDFRQLVSETEQTKLNDRQFQYFSMGESSRATVFSGCSKKSSAERCYIRWEWQKEAFIFVFETELENKKGLGSAALGKEFHEFVSRGIKAY
ncbi:hypothetical protein ACE5IS_10850 [Leptospira wolffii]|uniref:Lipoprotein n=1 Tax=Leptospira wolffii TaxID=409998 RepID=A0ABV5BPE4_9LEPT|nr:hypothetical protein [Leptospira wolffii]TGK59221.1 hypothetical protein EHQ32_10525 [Leptospira wolffii]TGK71398.1 hypothetical protein EHQ35_14820 [Leptospira wolffii]TGK75929.1 hypothetical protein EHQ27_05055 [Leptospira wolffii]TGL29325.1 hypothetical protein EHQ57_10335 [Leptospira wolffii]TGL47419.1 hypothetical protein EHQ61_14990 [Leptospira wolffii]